MNSDKVPDQVTKPDTNEDENKPLTKEELKSRIGELPKKGGEELRGLDIQQFLKMLALANKQPDPEEVSCIHTCLIF